MRNNDINRESKYMHPYSSAHPKEDVLELEGSGVRTTL